jgi:hypothetical protein
MMRASGVYDTSTTLCVFILLLYYICVLLILHMKLEAGVEFARVARAHIYVYNT